ncbi:CgeB family protein [Mucisphaera calidilacus]|uniref:Uncharacterized protein n=1 Tax=Mucisphaera calidilacus TaxID=2527982 RepID=A0A518BUZ5_9BACT|nr:glycosyltransferase [Mucisphaera calidilacus]QDU70789.1 hypothetical protein Pan265_06260 [Mucisphaera calidilacus]
MAALTAKPQPEATPVDAEQIRAYLERGRTLLAARKLIEAGADDEGLLRETAEQLVRQARWDKAAQLLERITSPSDADRLTLNLSRNLKAFRQHHPDAYQRLFSTPPQTRCRIVRQPGGAQAVEQKLPDDRVLLTGLDHTPEQQVGRIRSEAEELVASTRPIAVLSVRDGHVLDWIARRISEEDVQVVGAAPREISAVYVFESCPEVLVQTLMIHDWHRPGSPITSGWFYWFLGPDAVDQYQALTDQRPMLPTPIGTFSLTAMGAAIGEKLQQVQDARDAEVRRLEKQVLEHARRCTRESLLDVLGENPSRPPRLLAVTSLFTTVLQYATDDLAEAFRELGWEVEILKEQHRDDRVRYIDTWRRIIRFKPDLIFMIDHNRSEFGDLLPEPIPMVNWIQDHLPSLCNRDAGTKVGPRDYVLTMSRPTFVERFGYPDRQCIDFGKLSRPPQIPEQEQTDGPDLLYVSNASAHGETLIEQMLAQMAQSDLFGDMMIKAARALMEVYEQGGVIESTQEVGRILDAATESEGLRSTNSDARTQLLNLLWLPVNDALYRQQGLVWAADIADDLGLSMAIYGRGWEDHPRLGRYAKGPVRYGEDLEKLTRSAAINLRLEPYPTLAHQRMIDGLLAGGFFLSRTFGPGRLFSELIARVDRHASPGLSTLREAREQIAPEHRDDFERLVAACCACYDEAEGWDPVAAGRISQSIGVLKPGGEILPDHGAIHFENRDELRERVESLIRDAPQRHAIQRRQRDAVLQSFSYTSGMRRVIREVRQRIASESSSSRRACA